MHRNLGPAGGADLKSENVRAAEPGFAQVVTLKIILMGILFEDDVLIAGRGSNARGIERRKTDPGLDREVGGFKSGSIGNLDVAVYAVELKRLSNNTDGRGNGAALKAAVISAREILSIPFTRPPADESAGRRQASAERSEEH